MRLFVYGTLQEPALVARLTGKPAPMQPATLDGLVPVPLVGTLYVMLARGRGRVSGALILTDRRGLRRLAAYEGPRYRLTRVRPRVEGDRTPIHALAWIAAEATRHPFS